MNIYKPVIGLEIHVELKTQSKMFCQCSADYFGKPPNSHVCPVCLGMPGALPVPNKKAVEWTIRIAQVLDCSINRHSKFDRKHYFYPDLSKGYQISQYDEPIAFNGSLKLGEKNFRVKRVHLEEDTGKLIHADGRTLIDFNRSGVPLIEIVTEPDFDNADDVKIFLEELHTIIRYLDISDANMEEGSMRLEPNISIHQKTLNAKQEKHAELPKYKVEIKNINSFNFVKRAIEYEIQRQIELLEKGETPKQETRGFDEKKGITYSQRIKEEARDYRYFPDPDIPEMEFNDEYIQKIHNQLPELPGEKIERFIRQYSIKFEDAFTLTRSKKFANVFENFVEEVKKRSSQGAFTITSHGEQKLANFMINKIKDRIEQASESELKTQMLQIIVDYFTPKETDAYLLETSIIRIIEVNKKAVEEYKKGKKNAIMFLVGQVMKEMKGKADAQVIRRELEKKISQ